MSDRPNPGWWWLYGLICVPVILILGAGLQAGGDVDLSTPLIIGVVSSSALAVFIGSVVGVYHAGRKR